MMAKTCHKQESFRRSTCLYWAKGFFDAVSSYGESNYVGDRDCCKKTVILNQAGKNHIYVL